MGFAVTSRRSGPVSEELVFHGSEGSLVANSETCILRDSDGNVLERHESDEPPLTVLRRQGEAFARAVATNAKHYCCSGLENLLTLSIIEAAYLSNRTGQPEGPMRLLHTRELTVEQCLSHRPVEPAD